MQPAIQQVIRALAEDGRAGAINIAEHAVDSYLADAPSEGDRALSRDILVRDLASLRGVAPISLPSSAGSRPMWRALPSRR